MLEYVWNLPGKTGSHEVRLQIGADHSWIGRKVLMLDGRVFYRRGPFAGINHSFPHPDFPSQPVELRAEPDSAARQWCIRLSVLGKALPELSGAKPPPTLHRPTLLAVVTGLTYLIILMVLIMLPHIWRMLSTVYAKSDTRVLVMEVKGAEAPCDLQLNLGVLPSGTVHQPYESHLPAEGGFPPYRWEEFRGHMPPGLTIDAVHQTVRGVPAEAGEYLIWLRVTDSSGSPAEGPYCLSVRAPGTTEPQITTQDLPVAIIAEPYSAELQIADHPSPAGTSARYEWILNKSKLPKGIEADPSTGSLTGTPMEAGVYPFTVRVVDTSYSPWEHVSHWIIPFVVTAICLIGFWNMWPWSIWLYGLLILAQLGLGMVAPSRVPPNLLACLLEAVIFGVGASSLARRARVREAG